MGRQNWFEHVGAEHKAAREACVLFDQSSFAKYELSGADAEAALVVVDHNHPGFNRHRCSLGYLPGRRNLFIEREKLRGE